jgi:hypothetical protein
MQASVETGRCGPCCSIAPTGSTAITRSLSSAANSTLLMSCQKRRGSSAMDLSFQPCSDRF